MAFLSDTFTDADNTDLSAHTGETGATWTEHGSYPSGATLITSNRARCSAAPTCYYASGVPATAEYDVEGVIYVISNAGRSMGVAGRIDTAANSMYYADYDAVNARWEMFKTDAGTTTSLGTFAQTLSTATSYTIKLEIRDAAKKLYVAGVERISSADNAVTAAGRAGVRATITQGATGRAHLDSITASDVSAGRKNRVMVGGVFVDKPVLVMTGGVFVEKPVTAL